MAAIIHGDLPDPAREKAPQRRVLLFLAVWTVFVLVTVLWLIRTAQEQGSAGSWVIPAGDSVHGPWRERARDWFRLVNFNFQRIYPWVLLGPYVGFLGARFALERGRLRWNIPIHLVACAAFIIASHSINDCTANRIARVVIITSQTNFESQVNQGTNLVHIEISKSTADELGRAEFTAGFTSRSELRENRPDFLYLARTGSMHAGLTNLLPEIENDFKHPHFPPEFPTIQPLGILLDLFAYGAIIGLAHSVHFYRRYREREHRALSLESTLAKARLKALQTQLQPHFLFNSLNAIVTLVRRDPRLAETTLMSLSDLLRLTLSQSDKQEVTLREELQFVQHYAEIQQTRFGDRLHFEQDIEPASLDCLVPTLLLQPLVENAIRHGIEPSDDAGLVRLTARYEAGRLLLTVEDDGIGLDPQRTCCLQQERGDRLSGSSINAPDRDCAATPPPSASSFQSSTPSLGTGIGLSNLRARLETLYGASYKLELRPRSNRGVTVFLEIPCRTVAITDSTTANGSR
jgi:two-component sensor histidine kinase